MSQLSELTGAERADVVPGYVLSPLRLVDYGVAEDAFARWHLRRVCRGVKPLPAEAQAKAVGKAVDDVAGGHFTLGMPAFEAAARSARGSMLMLYLSLRVRHPQVTPKMAHELYGTGDEGKITRALFELLGYGGRSPKKAKAPLAQSSGATSSDTSATPPPSDAA